MIAGGLGGGAGFGLVDLAKGGSTQEGALTALYVQAAGHLTPVVGPTVARQLLLRVALFEGYGMHKNMQADQCTKFFSMDNLERATPGALAGAAFMTFAAGPMLMNPDSPVGSAFKDALRNMVKETGKYLEEGSTAKAALNIAVITTAWNGVMNGISNWGKSVVNK